VSEPLLTVDSLSAGYGDLRAVWDVSFTVAPGQILAILGRNGAGKSTTLRAISGLNPLMGGSIRFAGEEVGRLKAHVRARRGIALVQEGKRIFRKRTVEENLVLGGSQLGETRTELNRRLEAMYEQFPALSSFRQSRGGALSGGQQQMLAIAQALMAKPSLLMIDEPSGGLAPVVVAEVMQSMRDLAKAGTAVIVVEQAVREVAAIADRVLVMSVGRVVLDRPGPITDETEIRAAYLGGR
jgi:branched-chain amino acid transport system ATP-binding protein